MYDEKIRALRMERQHLLTPANETEYDALYRDLQPGQNFSQRCTASRSNTRR